MSLEPFRLPEMYRYMILGNECITIIYPDGFSEYLFGDDTVWKQGFHSKKEGKELRDRLKYGYMGAEFLGEIS